MPEPRATGHGKWFLPVAAIAAVFLYASLFSLSGTPRFRSGDESFFWTYAVRLLSGQIFLRDFHQFTPPGTDLVYAAVFRVFGTSVRTIDGITLGLGVALASGTYVCAGTILRPSRAALAALLAVVLIFGDRMDATHHWFSSIANLLAVACLVRRRTAQRIVAAGVLLALAAFFTQTRGAVGLLAVSAAFVFEWRNREISARTLALRTALLGSVTAAVWMALSWHFIAQAGLANYWNSQVAYLPKDAGFPMGFLVPHFTVPTSPNGVLILLERLAIYGILLVASPWVVALCLRRGSEDLENRTGLFLLGSLGVWQLLEVIFALNWNRGAAVAIPSTILAVYLIGRRDDARRSKLVAGSWCLLAALIAAKTAPLQWHHYPRVALPTGDALFEQQDAEEFRWLAGHTHPGDAFLEVANTRLYAPMELRNPSPVDLLTRGSYTLPAWDGEVVEGLEQSRTRYVLWSERSGIGSVSEMDATAHDQLDPLRVYLQSRYQRVQVFANGDEVWERRD